MESAEGVGSGVFNLCLSMPRCLRPFSYPFHGERFLSNPRRLPARSLGSLANLATIGGCSSRSSSWPSSLKLSPDKRGGSSLGCDNGDTQLCPLESDRPGWTGSAETVPSTLLDDRDCWVLTLKKYTYSLLARVALRLGVPLVQSYFKAGCPPGKAGCPPGCIL